MKTFSFIAIGLILLCLVACGDGDFRVNPTAGTLSTANSSGAGGTGTDKEYFKTNLLTLMTANTGSKSCMGSNCHNLSPSRPTFFQLDASSIDSSYNWAGSRRKSVTIGAFADGSSTTLKAKKDANHNSFSQWDAADKALIDSWSALP